MGSCLMDKSPPSQMYGEWVHNKWLRFMWTSEGNLVILTDEERKSKQEKGPCPQSRCVSVGQGEERNAETDLKSLRGQEKALGFSSSLSQTTKESLKGWSKSGSDLPKKEQWGCRWGDSPRDWVPGTNMHLSRACYGRSERGGGQFTIQHGRERQ